MTFATRLHFKKLLVKTDLVGIITSLLCLVHCMAFPFLISLEPIYLKNLPHDFQFLEYLFLLFAFVAMWYSSRKSISQIKISFYILFTLFIIGDVLEKVEPILHNLAYVGSFGLVITHYFNYNLMHQHKH